MASVDHDPQLRSGYRFTYISITVANYLALYAERTHEYQRKISITVLGEYVNFVVDIM